jgi:hypothetical protein
MIKPVLISVCVAVFNIAGVAQNKPAKASLNVIPVAKVWSGHPVGFDILTTSQHQYVCYYDTGRNMAIAQRSLNAKDWKATKLPTVVGWDSHNYVKMEIDKYGYIHVSGNMHNVPLIYFRSTKPENIDAFEKHIMTGKNEDRATYPVFFKDQKGDLYFQYRNGGSGQGISYWNKYDADKKQWTSLYDTPLFDGEEESNAYMTDPKLGPDGYFYIIWMWRLTPIANTNHNLSCVRSKDLVNWENMKGKRITLPIKWRDNEPAVDPVGPWNGLINMSFQISWNNQHTPYISYHKFDHNGISQLFLTRYEKDSKNEGNWKVYQVSDWKDYTWELNLGGSLRNSVSISSVKPSGKSELSVVYSHEKYGTGTWIVDELSMKVKRRLFSKEDELPTMAANAVQKDMVQHRKTDNTGKFILQWNTRATNQDKPRPGPLPLPSDLVVYEINKD